MHRHTSAIRRRLLAALLPVLLLASALLASPALASDRGSETIRVGYYALEGYHEIDANGLRSGYGYDFLTLMKRYADVTYEYVGYEKSWSDMQQLLLDGEIDMLTAAHRTAEREECFDYSLPIGVNTILLNVRADEERYTAGDYAGYSGMTIGLMQGSVSIEKLEAFASENGFTYIPRYYADAAALAAALTSGEVDAIAESSLLRTPNERTIAEFDTEYFYAIVRKGDTELLRTINAAITAMDASEPNWKSTLYYRHYEAYRHTELSFSEEELAYIAAHSGGNGRVVIAYDNRWAPFTYKADGVYTGILPDLWSEIMRQTGMEYEVYDSGNDIIDESELRAGKADIYMGYCFDAATSESNGFVESSCFMSVGAALLTRKGDHALQTIALSEVNPRLNGLLQLEAGQRTVSFPHAEDAVRALENGEVDAVFLYTYEGELLVNRDKTGLLVYQPVPDIELQLCAVAPERGCHILIGIVSKCINHMSTSDINTIISRNLTLGVEDLTLIDSMRLHPLAVAAAATAVALLLLGIVFALLSGSAEKRHRRQLEEKVAEITDLNDRLREDQARLSAAAAEQEAQLEEITGLNTELEERQTQLEEVSSEQEAQLEEVTALNAALEAQRRELHAANEAQQLRLNEIERLNELFKETQDHGIRSLLDQVILGGGEDSLIDRLVQIVGEYYRADRSYVFERDETGRYTVNTYEWCAEGISPEKDNLQQIPIEVIDPWVAEFRKKGSFYISCDDAYARQEPMVYEVLEPQGISSLMAAPMIVAGDIVGFIGVDNPRANQEHELYLSVAATAINHERRIIHEKEQEELYRQELERSEQAAQRANAAKSAFLFSMSHDIRTPMNAIIGYANLMKKYPDDRARCTDYLGKIISSSDFLLDLINNVLEMARIESGKMALDEMTWSILDFNDSLYAVFAEEMARKQLSYTRTVDVRTEYVFCDSVKLREIFLNLLSNALKYTPAGGTVHMELKELPSDREGYALMQTTISDTGIGMSPEFLPHLFEEFSREKTVTENGIVGTGLGMPIVKRLVDLMHGTIRVESDPGRGSTFIVRLYHRISSAAALTATVGPEHMIPDLTGRRILLAEDNDLNAEIAIELLSDTGAEIDRAEDGVICFDMLRRAERGPYDLILMDIQMPNLDGYGATAAIRRAGYEIPILAMTANAFDEDRQAALRAGMDGHLAKPIDVEALMKALSRILS